MHMAGLVIKDLRIESTSGRCLLSIPKLAVPAGTSLAIRGPSGAGKSTLLFALAGLIPINSGSVRWGDTDLAHLSDKARTAFRDAACGIIFQDHFLFEELSAAQNASLTALFAPRARRRRIAELAQDVMASLGVSNAEKRTVTSFSGGERQRIAVARALAKDPQIVLADEPTASLDRATADRLIVDLFGTLRGAARTLIVVSHDPALIAAADHQLTISDGQVADYV